jgi:hypothetical protein
MGLGSSIAIPPNQHKESFYSGLETWQRRCLSPASDSKEFFGAFLQKSTAFCWLLACNADGQH